MLTLEQQADFVGESSEVFLPIPGGWGRMGMTHIRLAQASEDVLTRRSACGLETQDRKEYKAKGKKRTMRCG
jgi:hypothetical protein